MPDYPELLTRRQVADRLGVNPRTIDNWRKAGKLHHIRLPGGHFRYSAAQIASITGDNPEFTTHNGE